MGNRPHVANRKANPTGRKLTASSKVSCPTLRRHPGGVRSGLGSKGVTRLAMHEPASLSVHWNPRHPVPIGPIGVFLRLVWLALDGFHWFRLVLCHLSVPSILTKGRLCKCPFLPGDSKATWPSDTHCSGKCQGFMFVTFQNSEQGLVEQPWKWRESV